MKAFFYLWCILAVAGFMASFFNSGHIYFSFIPSVLMACVSYQEAKQEEESK